MSADGARRGINAQLARCYMVSTLQWLQETVLTSVAHTSAAGSGPGSSSSVVRSFVRSFVRPSLCTYLAWLSCRPIIFSDKLCPDCPIISNHSNRVKASIICWIPRSVHLLRWDNFFSATAIPWETANDLKKSKKLDCTKTILQFPKTHSSNIKQLM